MSGYEGADIERMSSDGGNVIMNSIVLLFEEAKLSKNHLHLSGDG